VLTVVEIARDLATSSTRLRQAISSAWLLYAPDASQARADSDGAIRRLTRQPAGVGKFQVV